MADKKINTTPSIATPENHDELVIARARGFWEQYNKPIIYIGSILILLVGGLLIYQNLVKKPKEDKANDVVFYVQKSFQTFTIAPDSLKNVVALSCLNGDGSTNIGALKLISKYDGTDAANLCRFYAGACYLHMKQFDKSIKYLKEFNTSATQIKSRAFGMIGDAYSELKKNDDALEYYKKASDVNLKDDYTSSEFLFKAALFAETIGKKKDAVDLYKQIKDKYPLTQRGTEVDKYLARLGELND